ncbi:MAG: hypothetical protein QG549_990 [Patescibacteria group bacterium]|nr:hypothetical protein [Patescibacteria group bacterium]
MKPVNELMKQQMTRKDFLRLFAAALLSVFGISNFIQYLLTHSSQQHRSGPVSSTSQNRHGFGSSKFGS